MNYSCYKFKEHQVLALRREYLKRPFSLRKKSEQLGMSRAGLTKLLTGVTWSNLPDKVILIEYKAISKESARELYLEYQEKPFDLEQRAVELSCFYDDLKSVVQGCKTDRISVRKMTPELVLAMRREYNKKPFNIEARSRLIGVAPTTLMRALTSRTFKRLPDFITIPSRTSKIQRML